jgi:hypothetical protein
MHRTPAHPGTPRRARRPPRRRGGGLGRRRRPRRRLRVRPAHCPRMHRCVPTVGGTFGWEPGEWTDDTQMALAILTHSADPVTTPCRLPAIEAGFRAWYASGPADVGNQTSAVLRSTGPLDRGGRRAVHRRRGPTGGRQRQPHAHRTGCPRPPRTTRRRRHAGPGGVGELTHPDPDCVDACVLWSVAIDHTIHHAPPSDTPWDWADRGRPGLEHLPEDRRARWQTRIDEAAAGIPLDFPRTAGWCTPSRPRSRPSAPRLCPTATAPPTTSASRWSTPCEPGATPTPSPPSPARSSGPGGGPPPCPSRGDGSSTAIGLHRTRADRGRSGATGPPRRQRRPPRSPRLAGDRVAAPPLRAGLGRGAPSGHARGRPVRQRARAGRRVGRRGRHRHLPVPHGNRRRARPSSTTCWACSTPRRRTTPTWCSCSTTSCTASTSWWTRAATCSCTASRPGTAPPPWRRRGSATMRP